MLEEVTRAREERNGNACAGLRYRFWSGVYNWAGALEYNADAVRRLAARKMVGCIEWGAHSACNLRKGARA